MSLFKKKDRSTSVGPNFTKIAVLTLSLAVLVLVLFTFLRFGTYFFYYPIWVAVTNFVTQNTEVNVWLARLFAFIVTALIIFIVSLLFSWKKEKRYYGVALTVILVSVICTFMYYYASDTYFSSSGKALRSWCYDTLEKKFIISDKKPGTYNLNIGQEYKVLTPNIMFRHKALTDRREYLLSLPDDMYKDEFSGDPVKWYVKINPDSFFVSKLPVYHQDTGKLLEPVTDEIVVLIKEAKKKRLEKRKTALEQVQELKKRKEKEKKKRENEILRQDKIKYQKRLEEAVFAQRQAEATDYNRRNLGLIVLNKGSALSAKGAQLIIDDVLTSLDKISIARNIVIEYEYSINPDQVSVREGNEGIIIGNLERIKTNLRKLLPESDCSRLIIKVLNRIYRFDVEYKVDGETAGWTPEKTIALINWLGKYNSENYSQDTYDFLQELYVDSNNDLISEAVNKAIHNSKQR